MNAFEKRQPADRRRLYLSLLFQSRPEHAALLSHDRRSEISQAYIGILSSIGSAGWVLGALLYRRFFGRLTLKCLLNLSIALGTATTAAFLFF